MDKLLIEGLNDFRPKGDENFDATVETIGQIHEKLIDNSFWTLLNENAGNRIWGEFMREIIHTPTTMQAPPDETFQDYSHLNRALAGAGLEGFRTWLTRDVQYDEGIREQTRLRSMTRFFLRESANDRKMTPEIAADMQTELKETWYGKRPHWIDQFIRDLQISIFEIYFMEQFIKKDRVPATL